MKKQLLSGLILIGALATAPAALYIQTDGVVSGSGFTGGTPSGVGTFNQTIVDGNPAGMWNSISVGGLDNSLSSIRVTLNVSGIDNSGLYAYLSYNGTLVTLLNRIGVSSGNPFGNSSSGFNNITLDSTSTDIHTASGTLAGTYGADGRQISPLSSAASFDAAGTATLNGSYGGMNPNGTWTLFFADVVGGGGNATLNGWSLDITAVPEPVNVAMGLFGAVFVVISGIRSYRQSASRASSVD